MAADGHLQRPHVGVCDTALWLYKEAEKSASPDAIHVEKKPISRLVLAWKDCLMKTSKNVTISNWKMCNALSLCVSLGNVD